MGDYGFEGAGDFGGQDENFNCGHPDYNIRDMLKKANKQMIKIIVAYDRSNLIGNNGNIPWKLPEDMAHFKKTTLNSVVIMGYKTYQSLNMPMLPKRVNIVMTTQPPMRLKEYNEKYPHIVDTPLFFSSFEESLMQAELMFPNKDIYVIGGAQIYDLALKSGLVNQIIASEVEGIFEGDVYFPEFDHKKYTPISQEPKNGFTIVTYQQYL